MFDQHHTGQRGHHGPSGHHGPNGHHGPRHRRGGMRHDAAQDLHAELRHELRHQLRRGGGPGRGRGFDFRDMFGPGFGPGGRPRPIVRRGEVRGLILTTLQARPMHGYEVIQELEAQSDGRWRPSAGSVYPTLQQLADEGLVTSDEVDGRRTYTLTAGGQVAAKEAAASAPRGRWSRGDEDRDDAPDIRRHIVELASAAVQVERIGSPAARREVARILGDARKQLYRLLADDEPDASDAPDAPDTVEATDRPDGATPAAADTAPEA